MGEGGRETADFRGGEGEFANSPSPVQQKTSAYSVRSFVGGGLGLALLETRQESDREAMEQVARKFGIFVGLPIFAIELNDISFPSIHIEALIRHTSFEAPNCALSPF